VRTGKWGLRPASILVRGCGSSGITLLLPRTRIPDAEDGATPCQEAKTTR
jgi:hypothetical protein